MTAGSTILEMSGIYKTFPGVVANDHVNFSVQEGEIHGLLGENGAGKSTLMKVLFGLYSADSGSVWYKGEPLEVDSPQDAIEAGLGMVHQHFQLIPKLTVTENVVLGLRESYPSLHGESEGVLGGLLGFGPVQRLGQLLTNDARTERERVADVASEYGIDIDPDRTVSELDVGEQQRVEILKALYRDVDLLVLDEPTAVLTPDQIDRLFDTLRTLVDQGLTVIIITHKLAEVTEITDRVTVLRDGARVDTVETADVEESDLARMMVGREVIQELDRTDVPAGETVLEASNVHVTNDRGVEVLSGVDLTVRAGEVVGLAGVSGNGQRAFTDSILGSRALSEGDLSLNGEPIDGVPIRDRVDAGLSVIPADRHEAGCAPDLSLVHNGVAKDYRSDRFRSGPLGIGMDYAAAREHAESLVDEYDVRAPGVDVDAGNLSGGNLQKLILGREMDRAPSLLIANQPTRGLDVGATEAVRQQLLEQREEGTGVLLISEKLDEVMKLSDRIAVIYEGEIVYETDRETADRGEIGVRMSSGGLDGSGPPAKSGTRAETGSAPK
jgi:simple sugar transport system ATP-binding protein